MKNRYKLLITNHALMDFRGSETYCYTLAKELSKNHQVFVYTPKQGTVSKRMSEFATIIDEPKGEFDLILYNHNNTISDEFIAKCKIYTTHGIFHKLEKPANNMDIYVAVSNEVAKYYKEYKPNVIYNGIDLQKFSEINNSNKKKHVLYSSSSKSNLSFLLRLASYSLGLRYKRIGRKRNRRDDVIKDIEWADIVVGLGRTAMEALACGKKVIVADKRPYSNFGMDGLLTKEKVIISKTKNCIFS